MTHVTRSNKLVCSLALFVAGLIALEVVPSFPALPFYYDQGLQRVLLSALVCAFAALLGGARSLAPTGAGVRSSLRLGVYPLAVAGAPCAVELSSLVELAAAGGAPALSASWASDLVGVAFLCAFVGVFEEVLFRVVLFGGMLSRHGATRNGLLASAVVSSVVFGAVHVSSAAGSTDPIAVAQMLLKTAQAGFIGLLLCAVYVRTRSVLGVAVLHALTDFLLMAPLALLGGGEQVVGSYVYQGGDALAVVMGVALVVVYAIAVALYVPCAVRGWRLLETAPLPAPGPFGGAWDAREDAGDDVPAPGSSDGRPVPPEGL